MSWHAPPPPGKPPPLPRHAPSPRVKIYVNIPEGERTSRGSRHANAMHMRVYSFILFLWSPRATETAWGGVTYEATPTRPCNSNDNKRDCLLCFKMNLTKLCEAT